MEAEKAEQITEDQKKREDHYEKQKPEDIKETRQEDQKEERLIRQGRQKEGRLRKTYEKLGVSLLEAETGRQEGTKTRSSDRNKRRWSRQGRLRQGGQSRLLNTKKNQEDQYE